MNLLSRVGISAVAGLAMLAAVASTSAKADPATVTVAAGWVVVASIALVVTGAIIASATAKRNGCHWAVVKNVHGQTESVYICN